MQPEEIIAEAQRTGRTALPEPVAKALIAARGIAVPRSTVVRDAADAVGKCAGLAGPFAAKVISPAILHKSDAGGVAIGLADAAAVRGAIERMARLPGIASQAVEGWLIEEMAPKGVELVIGAFRDPQFGPMLMVGLGGILVEIIGDVSFRLCPIDEADANAMLDELKGAALLAGARGSAPVDRAAIVAAMLAVGGADGLMMRHAGIAELDVNPILAGPRGAVAVDARVILANDQPGAAAPPAAVADTRAVTERFRPLFHPRTVAVLGASAKGGPALANTFIRRLRAFGFGGAIYPIHPSASEIEGLPAYPSLGHTPEPVDYAYVAIGAERIPPALAESNGRVAFAQVVSSGFAEVEGGADLERDLIAAARGASVRVIGPNCLGTHSPAGGLTFVDKASPEPGGIALVSQSGGLTTNMIKRGEAKGIRFSGAVTVGNSADVTPTELIEYFLADPGTRAIGCYVEDIKDGRRLFELLRASRTPKPVVILRGGRSSQGRTAAASHTGALAGDGRAWSALARQTVTVEVDTLDEFLDTLLALQSIELRQTRPTRNVVMFGNGGGSSVLGTDFLAARGLDVTPFADDLRKRLEALDLLPGSSVANPIDTPVATMQQNDGRVAQEILDIVWRDAQPDAILLHLNMSSFAGRGVGDPVDRILKHLERRMREHTNAAHVVLAFRTDGDPELEDRKRAYRETARAMRLPLYDEIPEAAKVLAAIAHLERRLADSQKRKS